MTKRDLSGENTMMAENCSLNASENIINNSAQWSNDNSMTTEGLTVRDKLCRPRIEEEREFFEPKRKRFLFQFQNKLPKVWKFVCGKKLSW